MVEPITGKSEYVTRQLHPISEVAIKTLKKGAQTLRKLNIYLLC